MDFSGELYILLKSMINGQALSVVTDLSVQGISCPLCNFHFILRNPTPCLDFSIVNHKNVVSL